MLSISPLWSTSPITPQQFGSIISARTVTPFFAYWFRDTINPKWPGGSLNCQFSGIIVMSPGGTSFPFATKTFRPAEEKFTGTGRKIFFGEITKDNSEWYHSCFYSLIRGPLNLAVGKIAPPCTEHPTASWRNLPKPCTALPPSWCCVTESAKGCSII